MFTPKMIRSERKHSAKRSRGLGSLLLHLSFVEAYEDFQTSEGPSFFEVTWDSCGMLHALGAKCGGKIG